MKQHKLSIVAFALILTFLPSFSFAQNKPAFLQYLNDPWVNKLMESMTLEQKIGQLFIAQAYSKDGSSNSAVLDQVKNNEVGGIIFMQGTVENQARMTNELQKASHVPLLICTDGEWGPGMRMKDYPNYPYQMTLGALANDSLIYQMGREIGAQFRRLGVHVNFAPVSDVNNNPNNPVINYRSFGADPKKVSNKAWRYAQGLEDEKVLAVIKHFPGHGDTDVDSHIGMPVINHDVAHLDSVELYPFQQMISAGVSALMSGHIQVPALESNPKLPASLSKNILTKKLKKEMGYEGLIFTDAMNMGGITSSYNVGKASILAIKAGNDMLEIVPDIPAAIKAVAEAVHKKELSAKDIDYHCRRVLAMKKWLELDKDISINTAQLAQDLAKPAYVATRRQLHEQSITALINRENILPIQGLDTLKIAAISIGKSAKSPFQRILNRYTQVTNFSLSKNASDSEIDALMDKLQDFNLVIAGIHGLRLTPAQNYGTTPSMSYFLEKATQKRLIVTVFGNPYALDKIKDIEQADVLLTTYQDNDDAQEAAAQAIFGAIGINGKLPVGVNEHFKLNDGWTIPKINRLMYARPEEVKISSSYLEHTIDSIAEYGILHKAYPGCQVLIAVDGKVILSKSYGTHDYESNQKVEETDLYDIASVTKISSVTPALMKLTDDKKFNIDYPMSFYYPDFRNTDKDKITSREILAHQARLPKWIPFWSNIMTMEGGKYNKIFHTEADKKFTVQVCDQMFTDEDSRDLVYNIIRDAPLRPRAKYVYSDLGFMVYPEVISELTGESFPDYLNQSFFYPLGAYNIMYQPMQQGIDKNRTPPTEKDNAFRKQVVQGYVHDEGAAMLGGVSGNAGLFANANDLAKLMQMYVQYGKYGGKQYLDSATVAEFTRCQYPDNENRRALGFDKPAIDNSDKSEKDTYPSVYATAESFGHTGFTGTMVWMDPKEKITFIFLSNRTYPNRSTHLSKFNIRSEMLDTIYKALKKGL
ncbi:MAG: glycoside hydrolase family 3 N-terminal domain-containing protein [Mangrovibacterium sp.]